MASDRHEDAPVRSGDYRTARIRTGFVLTGALVVLLLFDAYSPEYTIDPLVLYGLLGMIGALFGLEGLSFLRGRP